MAPPRPGTAPRFRRRILALGLLATGALYVLGAPVFVNRIEDDLEQRVPEELAAAGFDGIAASFSGQDGTLACREPLDDPEVALDAAYDVWGVRAVELDRSCRVNRAPQVGVTTTVAELAITAPAGSNTTDATDGTDAPTEPVDTAAVASTPATGEFATVADVISADPQLSLFALLLSESEFGDALADGSRALTVFAPTDPAFDGMSADAIAELRSQPTLLRRVLVNHVVDGRMAAAELGPGDLVTVAGVTVHVTADGGTIRVGEATIVDADVAAGGGVVHVVDAVLVPADVEQALAAEVATVAAAFADGVITLTGTVRTEVERATLVDAAADEAVDATGAASVVDELIVDPDTGIDPVTVAELGRLVAAMHIGLVTGEAGFDGARLYVRGTFADEAGRDAVLAVTDDVGAVAELTARPAATADDAAALEADLNAIVLAEPVVFEPSSADLSDASAGVLDRVALAGRALVGIVITVEGHTDSDGDPAANLVLSQRRAEAVRAALVERGLPADALVAEGLGSERPVLVDGVEDKTASRRVEFRVAIVGDGESS